MEDAYQHDCHTCVKWTLNSIIVDYGFPVLEQNSFVLCCVYCRCANPLYQCRLTPPSGVDQEPIISNLVCAGIVNNNFNCSFDDSAAMCNADNSNAAAITCC